jgi:hypothetical protein
MLYLKSYRSLLPLVAVVVTALVLAERLYLLADRYAANIFFSDQWEFNDATVFQSHSLWQIFTWQHGPHRQGLGGVLAKLIEPHFQWDSRTESFLIVGIFVVAMLLAVWLKRRLSSEFTYYDVVIPSLFLTATQCEVIFGAANLAHGSLPVLLIVLYALAWTIERPIPRFVVILVLNFLLIFTGFGLLMGVITPLAILVSLWKSPPGRWELEIHLFATAIALFSIGLFFGHYRWDPAVSCYDHVSRNPLDYLHFAALIFANFVGFDGLTSRHPALWGALLLGFFLVMFGWMVAYLVRTRKTGGEFPAANLVPLVLLAFSLAFCAATVRGRLCLGFSAAQESRYMPYLTPGFLGTYLFLSRTVSGRWLRHPMLLIFLLVCVYASWPVHLGDQLEMTGFRTAKLRWKSCYLATRNIALCNRESGTRICNPPEEPELQQKLNFLEKEHLNLFNGR